MLGLASIWEIRLSFVRGPWVQDLGLSMCMVAKAGKLCICLSPEGFSSESVQNIWDLKSHYLGLSRY